jgi:predicted Zn-dependent protease
MLAILALALAACMARPEPVTAIPQCDAGTNRWAADPRYPTRNLRVWLDASAQTLDGWQPYGWRRLRFAMAEWNSIKLPVRLVEARSRRDSDIVVDVIEAIPGQDRDDRDQAGVTTVTHQSGKIIRARVLIAISAPFGVRYSVSDQVANLIHELGHALGLPHTEESRALMSRRRNVEELTAIDIALARRHFTCVAPGS